MEKIPHGDYIVYADESGDMSFEDKEYPVFVLAFCIFSKREYLTDVVRHIKGFKFDVWGHDMTVLHSKKIRSQSDDFRFLQGVIQRAVFMQTLSRAIEESPFTIISTGLGKFLIVKKRSSFLRPIGRRSKSERPQISLRPSADRVTPNPFSLILATFVGKSQAPLRYMHFHVHLGENLLSRLIK